MYSRKNKTKGVSPMLKNKSKAVQKTVAIAMILALDNKNYNKEELEKMSRVDVFKILEELKNSL